MQHFECDYLEGAHPLILKRLTETNLEKTPGYTADNYCETARQKIRTACEKPEAEIHFLVGGTQTNTCVINALLRPYEGVIAAQTGHINQHEAGAIEAGGHKVIPLPHTQGKLEADTIDRFITDFYQDESYEHMVNPGMVYISHPTEYGTLYTRGELEAISHVCKKHQIPLFLDGARLGYGLAAPGIDVTLPVIADCCDVFYIGGTKVGALFGEAVVIPQPGLIRQFISTIKQHGALLAKGRMLGIQFDTLFTDGLYLQISKHAIRMANILTDTLKAKRYRFFAEPQSNQIFLIADHTTIEKLKKEVSFAVWEKYDDEHMVIRIVTCWATREEDVKALCNLL